MNANERIAEALLAGDPEIARVAARAERALSVWRRFPRAARHAYPREARRLARRAAEAVLVLAAAAPPHTPPGEPR